MLRNSSTTKSTRRELMTFAEVAQALGISVKQVRRLALRGEFGRVYVSSADRRKHTVERARVESFRLFYRASDTTK